MTKLIRFTLFILITGLIACQKPGNIGEDLIAVQDSKVNVSFTDTLTIDAHSQRVDSVGTSRLLQNLLGSHYDPVFGTTTASFYTQLRLSQNDVNFGSNPVCDSIILTLDYNAFYGDSNQTQTIKVYQLDEDIFYDSTYYSNDSIMSMPTPIGSYSDRFNLVDSQYYNGSLQEPHLAIRLDNSLVKAS